MRLLLAVLLLAGCATSTKAKLITAAFDDPGRRRELFEANLRVLDRNPEWVDEFYAEARSHRPTLERFLENAARTLSDEKLAGMTARHLVAHPAGLRTVLERSMDAASGNPAAKKAIAEAVHSRAETAANIIVEDPQTLGAVTRALASKATSDKNARREIREGLGDALKSK
jgi:hypothetical protein